MNDGESCRIDTDQCAQRKKKANTSYELFVRMCFEIGFGFPNSCPSSIKAGEDKRLFLQDYNVMEIFH